VRLSTFTVATRYACLPGYAHAGYVGGLLSGYSAEPMSVRLRQPTPLEMPLDVTAEGGDRLVLRLGELVIAEAEPTELDFEVPNGIDFATASECSQRYPAYAAAATPGCFGCGVQRAAGDGMRLYAGRTPLGHAAAPWQPDSSLAGTRAQVRPEFHWVALSCPGYVALERPEAVHLGSLAARIARPAVVGERCVALAWSLGSEGRFHRVASALYGANGECIAQGLALWIGPRPNPS
jgi:hypothetical protein